MVTLVLEFFQLNECSMYWVPLFLLKSVFLLAADDFCSRFCFSLVEITNRCLEKQKNSRKKKTNFHFGNNIFPEKFQNSIIVKRVNLTSIYLGQTSVPITTQKILQALFHSYYQDKEWRTGLTIYCVSLSMLGEDADKLLFGFVVGVLCAVKAQAINIQDFFIISYSPHLSFFNSMCLCHCPRKNLNMQAYIHTYIWVCVRYEYRI